MKSLCLFTLNNYEFRNLIHIFSFLKFYILQTTNNIVLSKIALYMYICMSICM